MRAWIAGLIAVALVCATAYEAEARPKKKLRTVEDPSIQRGVAVFRQAGSSAADYWCNAGDFAQRKLGAGNGDALELVRPMGAPGGPNNRDSIGFTVVSGGGNSVNVSTDQVGERQSIPQTRNFCFSQKKDQRG